MESYERRGDDAQRNSVLSAVTFILALCLCAPVAKAVDTTTATGAMRVYRDPATGALGAPPPPAGPAEPSAPASEVAPATKEPLVAEPVDAPGGGIKVKLHGRFHAAVKVDVHGSQVGPYECVESGAAAHE